MHVSIYIISNDFTLLSLRNYPNDFSLLIEVKETKLYYTMDDVIIIKFRRIEKLTRGKRKIYAL